MAFVAPPLTLPSPATWWQDPKVRGRLIAAAVLVAVYAVGLAYGSSTRTRAAESRPINSRHVRSSCADLSLQDSPAPRALFFFNDTAPTEIYTLSLHDALPISPL